MKLPSLFETRCIHRHTIKTHPRCFLPDGKLKQVSAQEAPKAPKILVLDIETAPMEVYTWSLRVDYINHSNIINDWFMLSFAAKWLYSGKSFAYAATPEESLERNDSRLCKILWELLSEADIVITHNGNRFDIPKINTRLLLHGFTPPTHYSSIDTLSSVKRVFKFSSNSLDYINTFLGIPAKTATTFDLWKRCIHGDGKALKELELYNKNDIEILEDLYVRIRPWISNHPNLGLYIETDELVCSKCGSKDVISDGIHTTHSGVYEAFRCSCGAIGRSRKNKLTKEKKASLLA